MAGYTRQSVADIINGANITAPPLNSEFNQLQAAFSATTGHSHDGTTGNSPKINLATSVLGYLPVSNGGTGGLNNLSATTNPTATNDSTSGYSVGSVWVNTTTDRHFVCMDSTESSAVWKEVAVVYSSALTPSATNTVDIGSSSLKYKDIYIDGTAYIDDLSIANQTTFSGLVVAGNLTASGTVTISTADINGGAIDGTTIGATTPSTIVGTTITASTGFIGDITGDVEGTITYPSGTTPTSTFYNATVNNVLSVPNEPIQGNITASTGTSTFNNVTITGTLDMSSGTAGTITGLSAPSLNTDAATKLYVDNSISALVDSAPTALDTLNELAAALNDDASFHTTVTTALSNRLPLSGGTMTGAIDMGANAITTTRTPTSAADVTTKTYTDTTFLALAGGTMTGAITMGSNLITATYTPTSAEHLTTKTYVDGILGSATSAATSAAAAAASATSASTSASAAQQSASSATSSATSATASASTASTAATNAAASESNALTYKNAAEAAYDSFDDRYLGAKASGPSVDNDGNALIDGALYWDTTLNAMRVYDLGNTTWVTLADATDVATVAANIADVSAVAAIDADVSSVAGVAADLAPVAAISADIGTVAGVAANVTTVAGVSADVTTVAGVAANVTTVAANVTDVNTFATRYRIGAADPTTSLDAGDLFYNTSTTQLKVYNGVGWEVGVAAGSGTLLSVNNLSDVTSAATARSNLDVDQAGTALALSIALG